MAPLFGWTRRSRKSTFNIRRCIFVGTLLRGVVSQDLWLGPNANNALQRASQMEQKTAESWPGQAQHQAFCIDSHSGRPASSWVLSCPRWRQLPVWPMTCGRGPNRMQPRHDSVSIASRVGKAAMALAAGSPGVQGFTCPLQSHVSHQPSTNLQEPNFGLVSGRKIQRETPEVRTAAAPAVEAG